MLPFPGKVFLGTEMLNMSYCQSMRGKIFRGWSRLGGDDG